MSEHSEYCNLASFVLFNNTNHQVSDEKFKQKEETNGQEKRKHKREHFGEVVRGRVHLLVPDSSTHEEDSIFF